MELLTVAQLKAGFFRLVGAEPDDDELTLRGESTDDVAYYFLTRGFRTAQRWLIDNGFASYWRKRSSAITTWTGTDEANGGRYSSLPTDFLRLWDDPQGQRSTLVEADGKGWGRLIREEQSDLEGDLYFLRGARLWITRTAEPPATLYLEYHYKHPAFKTGATVLPDADIDFEVDVRPLGLAEAGMAATGEHWIPEERASATETRLEKNLARTQKEARKVIRRTRTPRKFQPGRAAPLASHW